MNLERRMAVEKLPSIQSIAQVILDEGAKLKSGGLNHNLVVVSTTTIVNENMCSESYHGGYLYTGWQGQLDGEPLLAHFRNWVRDGRLETDDYVNYLFHKLNDAPVGAALIISKSLETTEHRVYTKSTKAEWTRTEEYIESYKNWEDQGLFLPAGIRDQVASVLKCNVNSTYHRAFDAATHYINYGELPKAKSA